MTSTARPLRYALVILTTLLVIPFIWAYVHLTHQYPVANAQVTAVPQAITLNFSGGVETGFSDTEITRSKNENTKTLLAERNGQDQRQLTVPPADSLKPGTYIVGWHIVLMDGHKTKGHHTSSVK